MVWLEKVKEIFRSALSPFAFTSKRVREDSEALQGDDQDQHVTKRSATTSVEGNIPSCPSSGQIPLNEIAAEPSKGDDKKPFAWQDFPVSAFKGRRPPSAPRPYDAEQFSPMQVLPLTKIGHSGRQEGLLRLGEGVKKAIQERRRFIRPQKLDAWSGPQEIPNQLTKKSLGSAENDAVGAHPELPMHERENGDMLTSSTSKLQFHQQIDDLVSRFPSAPGEERAEADLALKKYQERRAELRLVGVKAKKTIDFRKGDEKQRELEQLEEELQKFRDMRIGKQKKDDVAAYIPQLTDEDYGEYYRAISEASSVILASHERSKIVMLGRDMSRLGPGEWLNDEIVNLCMSLMQERDMRWRQDGTKLKCHFFNSFFLSKLYKDEGIYKYDNVRRWTTPNKLKNGGQLSTSILDCDRIIVPVNQSNTHWTCAVIDLNDKKLIYYDSLVNEDYKCLENLAQYIKDEYKNKQNKDRDDVLNWKREFPKDIPRQNNGYDCGIFTILFADYLGRGLPLRFSQENIRDFRVRIACDILRLRID